MGWQRNPWLWSRRTNWDSPIPIPALHPFCLLKLVLVFPRAELDEGGEELGRTDLLGLPLPILPAPATRSARPGELSSISASISSSVTFTSSLRFWILYWYFFRPYTRLYIFFLSSSVFLGLFRLLTKLLVGLMSIFEIKEPPPGSFNLFLEMSSFLGSGFRLRFCYFVATSDSICPFSSMMCFF